MVLPIIFSKPKSLHVNIAIKKRNAIPLDLHPSTMDELTQPQQENTPMTPMGISPESPFTEGAAAYTYQHYFTPPTDMLSPLVRSLH